MELVIASTNLHKIREFRSILKPLANLDLFSLLDFPQYRPLEEIGKTFEEIAVQKAVHAARELNHWVIADDSGIIVPALQGSPGVLSARYAGVGATDRDNRQKLLQEMRDLSGDKRYAYFQCCVAVASPEGLKKHAVGSCEGTILTEERGSLGFGYDPIFVKYEYSKSFAELDEDIKNKISHRRKALDKVMLFLEALA